MNSVECKCASLNLKYSAIIATQHIFKVDCLQWNSILDNVILLSCRFIYSFQVPLTCNQNTVIIIVTTLPAGQSGFWILAGVNQIYFRFMKWYMKALCVHDDSSLFTLLEICYDMINQLIHNKINSKIKKNVLISSQPFGIDAQLPHFCPWNEM
jgi:hypothetical protein